MYDRIKRAWKMAVADFKQIFKNRHNKILTPRMKEITYRLIYNLTPLWGMKICSQCENANFQHEPIIEQENHFFFKCPSLEEILDQLIFDISIFSETSFDLDKAVLLNYLDISNPYEKDKITLLLAVFRKTIWDNFIQCKEKGEINSKSIIVKYRILRNFYWKLIVKENFKEDISL